MTFSIIPSSWYFYSSFSRSRFTLLFSLSLPLESSWPLFFNFFYFFPADISFSFSVFSFHQPFLHLIWHSFTTSSPFSSFSLSLTPFSSFSFLPFSFHLSSCFSSLKNVVFCYSTSLTAIYSNVHFVFSSSFLFFLYLHSFWTVFIFYLIFVAIVLLLTFSLIHSLFYLFFSVFFSLFSFFFSLRSEFIFTFGRFSFSLRFLFLI